MRLSDFVSHFDLAAYPTVALVIFLAVFAAVSARALRRPSEEMERLGRMPVAEDAGEEVGGG